MLKASHNVGTVTHRVYELENNPPGILPHKRLMGRYFIYDYYYVPGDVPLDGVAFSQLD